ncbi:MAG: glycosyltransferase family A protein [Oligoflexales bacterium]
MPDQKIKSSKTLTVAIATFNSTRTLEQVLDALIQQSIWDHESCEILVVDGGSTDHTLTIAKRFKCRILHNPQRQPVYAKFLALQHAHGKYISYLDHDEVLVNSDSLLHKVHILQKNKNTQAVITSGYRSPIGLPFVNTYINEFGDPFSWFIYNLSKDERFFINIMKNRYSTLDENNQYLTPKLDQNSHLPIIELVAAGSMINRKYFLDKNPELSRDPNLIPHLFYLLREHNQNIAILKDDPILHYSSDHFLNYLQKIRWRIVNNIHNHSELASAGFTGRNSYENSWLKWKKYLYIPYAFSIILPIVTSFYFIWTRKNFGYIQHIPLTLYTASHIVIEMLKKIFQFKSPLKSYDGKTEIRL